MSCRRLSQLVVLAALAALGACVIGPKPEDPTATPGDIDGGANSDADQTPPTDTGSRVIDTGTSTADSGPAEFGDASDGPDGDARDAEAGGDAGDASDAEAGGDAEAGASDASDAPGG